MKYQLLGTTAQRSVVSSSLVPSYPSCWQTLAVSIFTASLKVDCALTPIFCFHRRKVANISHEQCEDNECIAVEGNGHQLLTKHFPFLFPEAITERTGQEILVCSSFKIFPGFVYEKWAHELEGKILNYHSKGLITLCHGFLVSRRKASNKAFNSLKTGEEWNFLPFVCNFTVKNYHIKRASSCSGGLTKLSLSCCFSPFFVLQTWCRQELSFLFYHKHHPQKCLQRAN